MGRSRGAGETGFRGERELRGRTLARLGAGPRNPGSPSSGAWAPPPGPPSAPGRARGNTLPRGLSEPGRRVCQRVPRTLTSTPTPARYHCLPLPPAVPRTRESGGPAQRLFSPEPSRPEPGSRLTEPRHCQPSCPALVAWTDNLSTKRNQPKVRTRDRSGETAPHQVRSASVNSHAAGLPGEGVRRSLESGERREEEEERGIEGDPETGGRGRGGGGGVKEGVQEEGRRQKPGGRAGGGDRFV